AMLYENAGGIFVNHPHLSYMGNEAVRRMLDHSPYVLGIEVYNYLADWNYGGLGWARDTWHRILSTGRRCYGSAVPDHFSSDTNPTPMRGRNRLILPASYATMTRSEREQACLEAYFRGHWYAA